MSVQDDRKRNEREAAELTSFMMRKYYCENDVEAVIAQIDDDIIWLGTGENEYATGGETVTGIFRQFAGQVPKCNISEEEYHVLTIAPGVYLCSGRMWIATDASTQISLRVHQRVTTAFRRVGDRLRCCHIHISNPYGEMVESDVGFPTQMARQSYEYLQEQVELQKQKLREQTEVLKRMSYEDALTGLYNRNKFNQIIDAKSETQGEQLGVACFDLNGLKEVNDRQGHSAGDQLLCRAAEQLQQVFHQKVYRTGGDEFVVVEDTMEEQEFRSAVRQVKKGMEENGICCSVGISWHAPARNLKEQFDEADQWMYWEKRRYYSRREHDRRKRDEP